MGKIGVFGGTFNPIHNGHLHIAKCFGEQLALDSVLLIPSKKPTHKTDLDLAPTFARLEMCALAVEETGFAVSDMEITRAQDSYTVYTLEALKHQYPADTLYLLMGEDMFLTLLDWREPKRICELAVLCAAPRSPDGRSRLEDYGKEIALAGGRYKIVDIPFLPVSSTEIRQRLRNGQSISELVPQKVEQYINAHHLYQGGPKL